MKKAQKLKKARASYQRKNKLKVTNKPEKEEWYLRMNKSAI